VTRAPGLLLLLVLVVACRPGPAPARSLDPDAPVIVTHPVSGGGQVRFTVQPRYLVGGPIAFDLDVSAGTDPIRGPFAGHALQSDLGGEQTIRRFGPGELATVDVAPGRTAHATIVWDGKDDQGALLKAETYSLSLDFVVGDHAQRVGTVIQMRAP
jgi:hypothetical protein